LPPKGDPPFLKRAALRLVPSAPHADIEADPAKPTHGVPPVAIGVAALAAAWFVFASVVSFSGEGNGNYVLAVVVGFAVIFFGLTLGLANRAAHDRRYGVESIDLEEFVEDNVAIETGVIAGREAIVQILMLPVTLAVGVTLLGIVFWVVSWT
jgi:hypothetical protein